MKKKANMAAGMPEQGGGGMEAPKAPAGPLRPPTSRGLMDQVHGQVGMMGRNIGKTLGSPMLAKNRHMTGYGAVGLGGLGIGAILSQLLSSPKQDQNTEKVGSAFTDGFLGYCLKNNLNGNQVADLLEKGASLKDKTGDECRNFIERAIK